MATLDVDSRPCSPSSQTTMDASKLPDTPLTSSPTSPAPLRVLSEYHRGSISTTRTSMTESSQDLDEPLIPLPRALPRASYKLADFTIERTLGTGSFGRVHLG